MADDPLKREARTGIAVSRGTTLFPFLLLLGALAIVQLVALLLLRDAAYLAIAEVVWITATTAVLLGLRSRLSTKKDMRTSGTGGGERKLWKSIKRCPKCGGPLVVKVFSPSVRSSAWQFKYCSRCRSNVAKRLIAAGAEDAESAPSPSEEI